MSILDNNYYSCPYDFPWDFSKPIEENYCEVGNFEAILDKEGNIYQIPNGHTEGAIQMLLRDKNITRDEFNDIADVGWYFEWLLHTSETIFLRNSLYQGYANPKQLEMIELLKEKGLMSQKTIPQPLNPYLSQRYR